MTDSLLELDAIARDYTSQQAASTTSFRSLHSAVSDISSRSRKIREATRSHLRALKNVTKTEKELGAAIASYTIPDWLVRVGESCSRRPKGDVNCSTSELCKAMSRLVLSKAYLDSKPWNPVAESLGETVDRYVKNIVMAAEDRVLLKFMNASAIGSSANGIGSPKTSKEFPSSAMMPRSASTSHFEAGSTTTVTRARSHSRGHSRTFSSSMNNTSRSHHGRSLSTGSEMLVGGPTTSISVLFGDSPPADMLEASELLSALFKNYCRIRSVLEVKAHILDQIYHTLENRISEYRRLRIERGEGAGGGANSKKGLSSFFSSSGLNETAPERLSRALKELMSNILLDGGGGSRRRRNNNNNNANSNNNNLLNPDGTINSSAASMTNGITDYPECVFGVSKAARDLSLDISSFLEKYILTSVPPPPKRKTATEKLLDGSSDKNKSTKDAASSLVNALSANSSSSSPTNDNNNDDENNNDGGNLDSTTAGGAPLDPEAADEIDDLRNAVLAVPADIVEIASTFALDLLAKMVSELTVKEIYSLDTAPIVLLEAVQEAWAWRHVAREVCGETEELSYSIDLKVDAIVMAAFDFLANLRDEPSNLSAQSYLDLMLAPRDMTFSSMSFGVLYITGIQSLSESQTTNRDRRRVMNWHIDESFRKASWHPERDLYFGFSPLFVDAIRRMVSVHEATLHVVFSGSVDRVDGLIKRADKAIATKQAALIREAKHKQQRSFKNNNYNSNNTSSDPSSGIDFSNLNLTTMMEAESAAKGVFEFVRGDIEKFFREALTNHLHWMSSVASATFLLQHGTFEPDEITGEMTSYCINAGAEGEENLLWYGVAPGKLRFHPSIWRANSIHKLMRRLSAPGVFDVSQSSQLVWSHETMINNNNNNNSNTMGGTLQQSFATGGRKTPSASTTVSSLFPKKPDLSAFFSPQSSTPASAGGAGGFDLAAFSTPRESQKPSAPSTSAVPASSSSKPNNNNTNNNNNDDNETATTVTWRTKLLESLLTICEDELQLQVNTAGARWATILPTISENDTLIEIAESDQNTPLSHDQRAEVKQWYFKATKSILDELELWETGVVVVEDAGLRTTLGEAAFADANKVFGDMQEHVLKGREWSTRPQRWLQFPLVNLERGLRTFRAALLQNDEVEE